MSADRRTIARKEGVSTLSPGSPRESAGSRSNEERGEGSEAQADSRQSTAATRTDDASARQGRATIDAETQRLEGQEQKLERQIDKARERGDDRAVRTLQSQLDTTRNQLKDAEKARDAWPEWIVKAAQAGKTPQQMIEEIRAHQQQQRANANTAKVNESSQIIEELIDSGDDVDLAFARFLRNRVKAQIPVTRDNLTFHRDEFDKYELQPRMAADRQQDQPATTTTTKQTTPTRRTAPPRVAGAGGGDMGAPKTGWQEGTATIDLLRQGFREQDEARARH